MTSVSATIGRTSRLAAMLDDPARGSFAGAAAPLVLSRRAVLAAASLLAPGCRRAAPAARALTLGVSLLRISLPIFVAAERKLFEKHGLDVALARYQTAQPMVDDLLTGRLDAAGYAAYPIVLLASAGSASGPYLATSLLEDGQHRLSYALARPGEALRFPADLAGRTVGILPTIAYQRWLEAIVRAAGVDVARVKIVPVQPPMQASMLQTGGVDVLFTADPMATALLEAGNAQLIDDGPPCAKRLVDPFSFGSLALSAPLVDQRRDTAERLVAAIDEAIDLVHGDQAAARRAMAPHLRPEERPHVDRYPPARYLRSGDVPAAALGDEVARERSLRILDDRPTTARPWR